MTPPPSPPPATGKPPLLRRESVNDLMCQVCYCDFEDGDELKVLPCGHGFHGECISPWLKDHWTCPICKKSVVEEEEGGGQETARGLAAAAAAAAGE